MRRRRHHTRPLREVYAELNVSHFNGRLPEAGKGEEIFYGDLTPPERRRVMVRRVGVHRLFGTRGLRDGRGGHCDGLFFTPRGLRGARILVLALGGEPERRTLLHEMAHAAVWFAGHRGERHGPRFVAELERLATLGEAWAAESAAHYREHPD